MPAWRSALGLGLGLGLGLVVGACFDTPQPAVHFSCDPTSAPDCPPGYSCESDGCCHRDGSDVEAHRGECQLAGGNLTEGPAMTSTGSGSDSDSGSGTASSTASDSGQTSSGSDSSGSSGGTAGSSGDSGSTAATGSEGSSSGSTSS